MLEIHRSEQLEQLYLGRALRGEALWMHDPQTGWFPWRMSDIRNRLIYDAMSVLWVLGDSVNEVTVANELIRTGNLAAAGGLSYLVSLLDA